MDSRIVRDGQLFVALAGERTDGQRFLAEAAVAGAAALVVSRPVPEAVLDALGDIADPKTMPLESNGATGGSGVVFAGQVPCRASGQFGFGVRVLPKNAHLPHLFEPGLVTWG